MSRSGFGVLQIWAARLVLALGAEAKLDVVPGSVENAFPFSTLEDPHRVNEKLGALERKFFGKDSPIRVAIVGCGYSGVELAATISERLQARGVVQAINVNKTILSNAPPGNRESALKVLSSRNVQVLLGYFVRCIRRDVEYKTLPKLTNVEAIHDKVEANNHGRLVLELQPVENVGSMPSNATQRMLSEGVVLVIMKFIIIRQMYVSLFTGSHWYS
ncbi:Nuclear pore complex subunit [Orobanche minor]